MGAALFAWSPPITTEIHAPNAKGSNATITVMIFWVLLLLAVRAAIIATSKNAAASVLSQTAIYPMTNLFY